MKKSISTSTTNRTTHEEIGGGSPRKKSWRGLCDGVSVEGRERLKNKGSNEYKSLGGAGEGEKGEGRTENVDLNQELLLGFGRNGLEYGGEGGLRITASSAGKASTSGSKEKSRNGGISRIVGLLSHSTLLQSKGTHCSKMQKVSEGGSPGKTVLAKGLSKRIGKTELGLGGKGIGENEEGCI